MTFWHEVNGIRYNSRAMSGSLQTEAATLDDYRAIVRRAYGTLRGVTVGQMCCECIECPCTFGRSAFCNCICHDHEEGGQA